MVYCVFVDLKHLYDFSPRNKEKKKVDRYVCGKVKMVNQIVARKRTGKEICAHQYLYNSELFGLALGRKLYIPTVERLSSSCGILSVVGSLISNAEGLLLCLDDGCCMGSYAVSMSVLNSDTCVEVSLYCRSVVVSMS